MRLVPLLGLTLLLIGCPGSRNDDAPQANRRTDKILFAGVNAATTKHLPEAIREEGFEPILMLDSSALPDAKAQTWILQERIPGRLISLEGFVQGGNLQVLGFSRRTRIDLTEIANEFPADDWIDEAARARCRDAVTALVERSGYRNGYFHCEFITRGQEAHLIDGNIGRIGGGAFVEAVSLAYGIRPKDAIKHVALLPLYPDLVASPFTRPHSELKQTLVVAYGLHQAAVLQSISLPAETKCSHTQFTANGKRILPIGTSDSSWIALIAGYRDDVLRELDQIVIHTSEGPMKPVYCLEESSS